MRKVVIRTMTEAEYPLLIGFLYEAIFVRQDETPPPRDIVNKPELAVYCDGFGSKRGDHALVCEAEGSIVGAVWTRIIPGYGRVCEETPELAISLLPAFRGQGIGTKLFAEMLLFLQGAGYRKASLAVQKDNYAFAMYRSAGFTVCGETEQEYIMTYSFNSS